MVTHRRLSPEHADRHDLRIQAAVFDQAVYQALQGWRGPALVLPAEPVGRGRQVEEGHGLDVRPHGHRQHRTGQVGLAAFMVDHRQVAARGRLQDVENRPAAIQVEVERWRVDGLRPHPQVQQATQGTEEKTAQR
jgi:hypothetical protein